MAQSDQVVQNATFPTVRADINDNLAALYSQSSGSSAPSTTVAFQPWVDTSSSPPVWKVRNAANSAWITVGVLDPAGFNSGGVTPIANGGTGQTTVAAAIAALLPSQTGNADKALITNGTALLWGSAIGSSFTKYETTGTFTFTKPANASAFIVLCWGGGGSGGRQRFHGGGGGGGGACSIGFLKASEIGSTETITVGGGGASRSGQFDNGASGSSSSFGSHVVGYGGSGGENSPGSSDKRGLGARPFGNQGQGSIYDKNALDILSGGSGGMGNSSEDQNDSGGNATFGGAGGGGEFKSGGTSVFGGNGGSGGNTGSAGSQPGGGGGGSTNGSSGAGGIGAVWVIAL